MTGSLCAVKVCFNNRKLSKKCGKDIHYHKFPKDPIVRQKWIDSCKRPNPFNPNTSQICSVHFTTEDYVRDLRSELLNLKPKHRLKPEAVPSLHLHAPVEWYPRTKIKTQKAPTNVLPPKDIKIEDEEDETLPVLNQIFLLEVPSVEVKKEKDSDGQENEFVMQNDKGRLEVDPLNTYDILLEKYNFLLRENAQLKKNLKGCELIIEKQKRKIEQFKTSSNKVLKKKHK
jgi:hypothetical protein